MKLNILNVQNVDTNGQSKYLDILEEAWQQHLVPREPNAPTVISTFAGCGGSSLGYSMAGYRELLAVEWDNKAVATFKLNFPDVPVYHGDIHKLTVDHCLKLVGLQPGELDLLDGSPPCQGFSTAGKRQMDDIRNQLSFEFVRLLRGLEPKVFVMENVSGLIKGKMKLIFAEIMKALKASGYQVKCQLLNAMYFHIPQSRERLIWIGVRDDLGIGPSYPKGKGKPFTVTEAWVEVPHGMIPKVSPGLLRIIPNIPIWGDGGDVTGQTYFGTKRLSWGRPSRTLIKEMSGTRTALIHPSEDRVVTLEEAKRLGSYPDGFEIQVGYGKGMYQIGNSVPPLFMKAIAEHIRQEILNKTGLAPVLASQGSGD